MKSHFLCQQTQHKCCSLHTVTCHYQTTLFQASKKTAHRILETGFPWKFIRNIKSEFASAEISTRLIVQIII